MTEQPSRSQNNWQDSTRAVHAGETRNKPYHALIDPIVPTSTYVFDDYDDIQQFITDQNSESPGDRLDYGRYGNPTVRIVEAASGGTGRW